MMQYFIYNDQLLITSTKIVGPDHRGLKFGDGLFETIKYTSNQLILADFHFERMFAGLKKMQFEIPEKLTPAYFSSQIERLIQQNELQKARVRISIYRADGGLATIENNIPDVMIQCFPLPHPSQKKIHLGIYHDMRKPIDSFSNLKLNNFLLYRMAAVFATQNQYFDALVLNAMGRICESSMANIFLVSNHKISTVSLSEGPIAGVMRKFILHYLRSQSIQVEEKEITIEDVLSADEVFLTNSIRSIQSIDSILEKQYTKTFTQKLKSELQQAYPLIFP